MYSTESLESSDDFEKKEQNWSDCLSSRGHFRFPFAPRLSKSANNSYCSTSSDSSNCELHECNRSYVLSKNKKRVHALPSLGIYWDIENCQVPRHKNAAAVVQKIREVFLKHYKESEFVVVCDIKKENPQIIQELHDSQVDK